VVPAPLFGEPVVRQAWAVTFATDVAFGYFVALAIFGRHPVVPFFLVLAIAANVFGFIALAPAAAGSRIQALTRIALMAPAIATAVMLRWLRVGSFWPYVALAGGLSWLALLLGGVHPALALVPVIPLVLNPESPSWIRIRIRIQDQGPGIRIPV
jgi:NhaA family Na+:H+ antiporter